MSKKKTPDDLDDLLGEIAATGVPAVDPLDSLLDEIALQPAESVADDLDALLDEVAAPEAKVEDALDSLLDEVAPQPAESVADDLDALLDEVAAPEAKADDPLDSLLDEVTPLPAASDVDDLASVLDEVAIPEEPVPAAFALPDAVEDQAAAEPADAVVAERGGKSRPFVRKALLGLSGVVILAVTNGLSYYLGAQSQAVPHGEAVAVSPPLPIKPAPPPVLGLDRYVGKTSDVRIDGRTIFQDAEIKAAIQHLDGGEALQREVEKASRRYVSVVPIDRSGTVIRVYSCNRQACDRDNVKIYYSLRAKRAGVCRTEPYLNGAHISYAYSQFGWREVPNCDRNPFPKGI